MNLEPIRNALSTEPLLVLSEGDATLACDAKELIFADALGVQRLELREIRKVTHVEGHLVVTSNANSIRGVLNVDSSELKAFFADLQTLRKQRDVSAAPLLESRFKPAPEQLPRLPLEKPLISPLEKTGSSPLEQPRAVPLEKPSPAPLEIPGFSVALGAASAEVIAPRVPPAPIQAPAVAQAVPAEPSPAAAPIEDLLQYQPRPPKPNPRANPQIEREQLTPPKPNPRAAVTQPPAAPPPQPTPSPASTPERPAAAPEQPRPQERPAEPLEKISAVPLEKPRPAPLEKTAPAPLYKPRAVPLEQPQAPIPKKPRVAAKPRVSLDFPALLKGLQGRLAQATPDLRFNLRRAAASAIDGVFSLILMWGATRIIGGRELETLLRLPVDTRADLNMLISLKDLLPLFISGALSGVLSALAAGLLYTLVAHLSPPRGTPGKYFLGLRLTLLGGARVTPAVLVGRYLVNAMLLLVPSVLGLLPTLIALNGPAIALRSSLELFGYANLGGLIVLLIGQLPIYGPQRAQKLADYLTDCIVSDAPEAAKPQS